jgi:hypothetical protein
LIEENKTNENEMDIEENVERGENENVQTEKKKEKTKVGKNWKQIMKKNLQNLHV